MKLCPKCQYPNPDDRDDCWSCQSSLQGILTQEEMKAARQCQDARERALEEQHAVHSSLNRTRLRHLAGFFTKMGWVTIFVTVIAIGLLMSHANMVSSGIVSPSSFLMVLVSGVISACIFWAIAAHLSWAFEMQMMQAESINILKEIRDKT